MFEDIVIARSEYFHNITDFTVAIDVVVNLVIGSIFVVIKLKWPCESAVNADSTATVIALLSLLIAELLKQLLVTPTIVGW